MTTKFEDGFTYVASPYSHNVPAIMEQRYQDVMAYVAMCMRAGEVLYSPIVHHHVMATMHDLPCDWPFWRRVDGNMLGSARELRILKLDGWKTSVGVQAEIAIAMALGIPIIYAEPPKEKSDERHDKPEGSNWSIQASSWPSPRSGDFAMCDGDGERRG